MRHFPWGIHVMLLKKGFIRGPFLLIFEVFLKNSLLQNFPLLKVIIQLTKKFPNTSEYFLVMKSSSLEAVH